MRWGSRRNGGNNMRTRFGQSIDAQARNGQGRVAGHHSYAKGHGGGNKVGAISHAPKEWGSKARKEEERLTGLARQAELDAIEEFLEELDPDYEPSNSWLRYRNSAEYVSDQLLDDAFEVGVPGVTLNGNPIEPIDDGPDFCPWCGHMI